MNRKTIFLVSCTVLTGIVFVPLSVSAQADAAPQPGNQTNTTQSNGLGLGEQISVFMVTQAGQISGDIEESSFTAEVNNTRDVNKKAEIIQQKVEELKERKEKLKEQRKELQSQYKNGSISRVEFVTKLSSLSTSNETISEIATDAHNQTGSLPEAARKHANINSTAIEMLKQNASSLSGQQVSEIAKSLHENKNQPAKNKTVENPSADKRQDDRENKGKNNQKSSKKSGESLEKEDRGPEKNKGNTKKRPSSPQHK